MAQPLPVSITSSPTRLCSISPSISLIRIPPFEPEELEDHYEAALTQLINRKRSGKPIEGAAKVRKRSRPDGCPETLHLDALKRSIANDPGAEPAKGKKPRKAAAGQKEMLLPISGERAAKAEAKKDKPAASRARKRA